MCPRDIWVFHVRHNAPELLLHQSVSPVRRNLKPKRTYDGAVVLVGISSAARSHGGDIVTSLNRRKTLSFLFLSHLVRLFFFWIFIFCHRGVSSDYYRRATNRKLPIRSVVCRAVSFAFLGMTVTAGQRRVKAVSREISLFFPVKCGKAGRWVGIPFPYWYPIDGSHSLMRPFLHFFLQLIFENCNVVNRLILVVYFSLASNFFLVLSLLF